MSETLNNNETSEKQPNAEAWQSLDPVEQANIQQQAEAQNDSNFYRQGNETDTEFKDRVLDQLKVAYPDGDHDKMADAIVQADQKNYDNSDFGQKEQGAKSALDEKRDKIYEHVDNYGKTIDEGVAKGEISKEKAEESKNKISEFALNKIEKMEEDHAKEAEGMRQDYVDSQAVASPEDEAKYAKFHGYSVEQLNDMKIEKIEKTEEDHAKETEGMRSSEQNIDAETQLNDMKKQLNKVKKQSDEIQEQLANEMKLLEEELQLLEQSIKQKNTQTTEPVSQTPDTQQPDMTSSEAGPVSDNHDESSPENTESAHKTLKDVAEDVTKDKVHAYEQNGGTDGVEGFNDENFHKIDELEKQRNDDNANEIDAQKENLENDIIFTTIGNAYSGSNIEAQPIDNLSKEDYDLITTSLNIDSQQLAAKYRDFWNKCDDNTRQEIHTAITNKGVLGKDNRKLSSDFITWLQNTGNV